MYKQIRIYFFKGNTQKIKRKQLFFIPFPHAKLKLIILMPRNHTHYENLKRTIECTEKHKTSGLFLVVT